MSITSAGAIWTEDETTAAVMRLGGLVEESPGVYVLSSSAPATAGLAETAPGIYELAEVDANDLQLVRFGSLVYGYQI
jgi:hypothetical protein